MFTRAQQLEIRPAAIPRHRNKLNVVEDGEMLCCGTVHVNLKFGALEGIVVGAADGDADLLELDPKVFRR